MSDQCNRLVKTLQTMIDWLILTTGLLVCGYFMSRGLEIAFVCIYIFCVAVS